ncbi:hypothetical protein [Pelodictyon phaeoclathratiforme]|jgi:hypothetical protein|uniref:Uncharacterized protein n=1 Tax=Pelodictyon phaeoclathratiforme (strain DSM 5477 / BU-1) TaxID=324925 RepID=B4SGV6_PELPB|nr:hypothetical protein [Pelodictyon phaeoclathratiforme]ACF44944.1 conserved hypothetical protein [Pelodictyon phaeoclathratiforme BU-1]MBV5288706.1 hypothetical protein [Pelodictyon phaeoclathratiforme]
MMKKISKTDDINARLERDGKVTVLDKKEHIEAIIAMNKQLEAVRREYQIKDRKSQITAANDILTM